VRGDYAIGADRGTKLQAPNLAQGQNAVVRGVPSDFSFKVFAKNSSGGLRIAYKPDSYCIRNRRTAVSGSPIRKFRRSRVQIAQVNVDEVSTRSTVECNGNVIPRIVLEVRVVRDVVRIAAAR